MDRPHALLGTSSISRIAELALCPDDVKQACTDFGLAYVPLNPWGIGIEDIDFPSQRLHAWHVAYATLEAADRSDPNVIIKIMYFTRRLAELATVARTDAAQQGFPGLRRGLEDDGFYLTLAGDPLKVLDDLSVFAHEAVMDSSGIRAELRRLESALPRDPSAAIGRAKNLIEATAEATLRGPQPVS
ncbi:hypothetical protein AB0H43_13140 [Hamadaea sp. NPDC050747]|uniref:hypothetical protein n=1 Tax=Hamadaea sp. NPDC050747 TaxID=3155789 RepID=UPI0033C22CAC